MANVQITKPIFVLGSGRSGTSIMYYLLSVHPEVCWFSNWDDVFPKMPQVALLHRILDLPYIGQQIKRNVLNFPPRYVLRPSEGANIYRDCGFDDGRKTTADDYREETATKFKRVIRLHLALTGRKRFLSKRTSNTQRIQLINAMFPDAYYVHVIRDGRAVVNSLLRVPWWPDLKLWWHEQTPAEWEQAGKDPVTLCGMHWLHNLEEILQHKALLEGRYIEIQYEALVANTRQHVKEIASFCELNTSASFDALLPEKLPNMNRKWQQQLTESQQATLYDCIGEQLTQLGYTD